MSRTSFRILLALALLGGAPNPSQARAWRIPGVNRPPLAAPRLRAGAEGAETWAPLARIGFDAASMIVDPRHDRLVLYGGLNGDRNISADVWVKPLSGGSPWTRLDIAGPLPVARSAHAAIYDPLRGRMVVFGDTYSDGAGNVWALSLSGTPAWTEIATAGVGPGFRSGVHGIYDPAHDRMVVFGGYSVSVDSLMNDVWALSLSGTPTWSRLSPTGSPPTRRTLVAMTYDPIGGRMIAFGGYQDLRPGGSVEADPARDVWSLSLTDTLAWTQLQPGGDLPPRLYNCASAYDPMRRRMLLFGGSDSTGDTSGHPETWALDLAASPTWSLLQPQGALPPGRAGACAVYDSTRDQLVMVGGSASDTWSLSLTGTPAWSELEPGDGFGPGGRYMHSVVYDSTRHRVLLFAGTFDDVGTGLDPRTYQLNDLWSLSFSPRPTWQPIALGASPPPGTGHSVILDPVADRLIVFGGSRPNPSEFWPEYIDSNEVWSIPMADGGSATTIAAGDSAPSPRELQSAIYDPLRRRMIVFGGANLPHVFGDVWTLALDGPPQWTRLAVVGPGPGPRYGHGAIYDPVGDRMIVFGGSDGTALLNESWQLTLAGAPTWSPLPSAIRPPARSLATLAYDSHRQRLVLFGGNGVSNDTWVYPLADGASWMPAAISGDSPAARFAGTGVFDPEQDRVVVIDGLQSYPTLDYNGDVWTMASSDPALTPLELLRVHAGPWRVALAWQGGLAPTMSGTVERRTTSSMWAAIGTVNADATGALAFEDVSAVPGSRYGYRLAWSVGASASTTTETWVDVPRLQFALAGPTPNPTTQGIAVLFSLPDATAARLDLVDIAGRRVLSQNVGALGPGDHSLTLTAPGALSPGIYLVRISRGSESVVKRVCVIR